MGQIVCQKNELQPGEIMEVAYKKHSIALCRSKTGEFYAFLNQCPHQGAPMSKGKLCSTSAFTDTHGEYRTIKDGEVLRSEERRVGKESRNRWRNKEERENKE